MVMNREALQRDVESTFRDPQYVLEAPELSVEQKLKILESWRLDLLELQRASEENMPSANAEPGEAAERLRRVEQAIATLQTEASEAGGHQ